MFYHCHWIATCVIWHCIGFIMVHVLSEGHIAPFIDIDFEMRKMQTCAVNSLGPHTACWSKAWDFQKPCSNHFPGDASSTILTTDGTFMHSYCHQNWLSHLDIYDFMISGCYYPHIICNKFIFIVTGNAIQHFEYVINEKYPMILLMAWCRMGHKSLWWA